MNNDTPIARNEKFTVSSPAPFTNLDGNTHTPGEVYKFLGFWGCGFARLSRVSDKVKLTVAATFSNRVTLF